MTGNAVILSRLLMQVRKTNSSALSKQTNIVSHSQTMQLNFNLFATGTRSIASEAEVINRVACRCSALSL